MQIADRAINALMLSNVPYVVHGHGNVCQTSLGPVT